jgi:hypothetical protein
MNKSEEDCMNTEASAWRACSTCKKPIAFAQTYYLCSVSTCNRKRTGLAFCSMGCWDAHVPIMRHREAWAEELRAPTRTEWERERQSAQDKAAAKAQPAPEALRRRMVLGTNSVDALPKDILVVVSKLKKYIKQRADMNTSDSVTEVLSDHLRSLCDQAIANAAQDGRKTVMDRDFLPLVEP